MSSKTLFAMAAAMLLVPVGASAQLATGAVDVTATVDAYAAITGSGDVAFGSLSRTVDNVIDPAGGASAAQRTVTFNSNIDISFSGVPAALSGPGGASLPVALRCSFDAGSGWSVAAACSGLVIPLDNTTTGEVSALLGFGGEILAADVVSVAAGSYSGTFDVVVTAR
jgi:hypothetical protein